MRKSKIQEIELSLEKNVQLFEEKTLTKLQESTVKKALSIILDAYKKCSELGFDTEVKVSNAFDYCKTEEEFVIVLNKISSPYENERIYFNVPYKARKLAKFAKCCYDSEKKLWFTYSDNDLLSILVDFYGVNEATSEKAMNLLKAKTEIQW